MSAVSDFAFVFQGFVDAAVSPFLCKITKQNPTNLLGRIVSEHENSHLSLPCVCLLPEIRGKLVRGRRSAKECMVEHSYL